MPYLPAKDEIISLNWFSSRGLKTGIIQRFWTSDYLTWTQHFTFCRFFRKRNFFGNFDRDFGQCFTKGIFLTEHKDFWNFSFDGEFSMLQAAALKKAGDRKHLCKVSLQIPHSALLPCPQKSFSYQNNKFLNIKMCRVGTLGMFIPVSACAKPSARDRNFNEIQRRDGNEIVA